MADNVSKGYGTASSSPYTVLLGGKQKINKAEKGNKRYGMKYTTVRRKDGMKGHRYGDGRIVWVKQKSLSPTGGAGYES